VPKIQRSNVTKRSWQNLRSCFVFEKIYDHQLTVLKIKYYVNDLVN
jgi:hypothetical protein